MSESQSPSCPTCGKTGFKSEMGMRLHHTKAHGESLITIQTECANCGTEIKKKQYDVEESENYYCTHDCYAEDSKRDSNEVKVECNWCEDEFTDTLDENYQTKKYCSKECRKNAWAASFTPLADNDRSHHHEICEECGVEFEARPSHNRRFCSQECMGEHRKERYSGENNPNHKGKVALECEICGDSFKVKPSVADNTRFCGMECKNKWLSEFNSGEGSPRWKGGYRSGYGNNWLTQREKRLEMDDYSCVVCGMSNENHKKKSGSGLHVHHIKRKEEFRNNDGELDDKKANDVDNLITMCNSCHQQWEGIPVVPNE